MKKCVVEGCGGVAKSHRRCLYHKVEAYRNYMSIGGTKSKYPTFAKFTRSLDGLPVSVMEGLANTDDKENKKPKGKVCKGNYRSDRFEGCGLEKPIRRFGLCSNCYVKWLSSGGEKATSEVKKIALSAKKTVERKKKAKKKKEQQAMKTLADWRNDLQAVVNWIVKQIDKENGCISHPNIARGMRWDAGHYYSVKVHQDLRFNLHNIHKQGSYANTYYGGCPEFLVGLEGRYGKEYADMVQYQLNLEWKGVAKEFLTIDNIRTIYLPNARRVKRDMQKGTMYTREQVNELIGIYTLANKVALSFLR